MDKIFIYPTDTLWGIGAPYNDQKLQDKIREAKGSDFSKPHSLIVGSYDQFCDFVADEILELSHWRELYKQGLTLLLPLHLFKKALPKALIGESEFGGIRLVETKLVKELTDEFGALSSTSVNTSGKAPAASKEEAEDFLKENLSSARLIYDGVEAGQMGSTILIYQENRWKVLREGENTQKILGQL